LKTFTAAPLSIKPINPAVKEFWTMKISRNLLRHFFLPLLAAFLSLSTLAHADVALKGINFSGGEFGSCSNPVAKYGFSYIFVDTDAIDSFRRSGMNVFRLPFCWERLQPSAMSTLDKAELARIDKVVQYATSFGASVILDPHNFGSYWKNPITTDNDKKAFADLWRQLAIQYKNNDKVIFGLMNEPISITGEQWINAANQAIDAIRKTGAHNLILVPGVAWTGAHSWGATSYGTPNAITTLNVVDSANNYAYEVHQYFDKDSSGSAATCVDENIGVARIVEFEKWLRANHKKAFLGEFGAGGNTTCFAAVSNVLEELRKNSDIWLGWAYWNAGPWQDNYMFNIPHKREQQPQTQMDVLNKFLDPSTSCGAPNNISCASSPPTMKQVFPLK